MSTVIHLTSLVGFICLTSCTSPLRTPANFVPANGPPIEQLGLKKVEPSEVIVREIPDSALRSKESLAQWALSKDKSGEIPLGVTYYSSEYSPDIVALRKSAADFNALIVYTKARYLGRKTKTVSVPIMYTDDRTVTTRNNTYANCNNQYGVYGTSSYSGYGTSSTYIPGTTVYAPKQIGYNDYSFINLYCVPRQNVSPKGLKKIADYQVLTHSN